MVTSVKPIQPGGTLAPLTQEQIKRVPLSKAEISVLFKQHVPTQVFVSSSKNGDLDQTSSAVKTELGKFSNIMREVKSARLYQHFSKLFAPAKKALLAAHLQDNTLEMRGLTGAYGHPKNSLLHFKTIETAGQIAILEFKDRPGHSTTAKLQDGRTLENVGKLIFIADTNNYRVLPDAITEGNVIRSVKVPRDSSFQQEVLEIVSNEYDLMHNGYASRPGGRERN